MANNEDFLQISTMFKSFLKGISQDWNKQDYPLNITQFKTLRTLSKNGPQNVSQIAAALGITSAAITGVTDQLIAEDYVNKERAKDDRRVVHITITQKGEATIKDVQERHQELMESYFKILPDEDIEHLRRIFAVIISDLDKR
ncbi:MULTISPECIES: MarR family winged helix-turn-helix transcriptional regulator [Paenibacillus]|uniref:MarR family winged helix-turn-helix transcriptional regulator n=1 Tax=Paenibacillus TaxID=44249 RepID=UPI001180A94C|nr:MarR family transcriptional regulator [Paenibacillus odorifer]